MVAIENLIPLCTKTKARGRLAGLFSGELGNNSIAPRGRRLRQPACANATFHQLRGLSNCGRVGGTGIPHAHPKQSVLNQLFEFHSSYRFGEILHEGELWLFATNRDSFCI